MRIEDKVWPQLLELNMLNDINAQEFALIVLETDVEVVVALVPSLNSRVIGIHRNGK